MATNIDRRMMKLGAFVHETGQHVAAWRHPEAYANSGTSFAEAADVARTAERGKFDLLFLADSAAVSVFGIARIARPHGQTGQIRADDTAVGAGGGDHASRPGRDLYHDLQPSRTRWRGSSPRWTRSAVGGPAGTS